MGVDYYKGQKYEKLKKELLKSGQLFTDPEFLPNQKSLFYSRTETEVIWKRPTELCNVPKLVVDGTSCEDLIEGEYGNRWFVTACSNLANHKALFNKVIPGSLLQEYNNTGAHAGIFKFQFWLFGTWTEVVVDDLLPTKHGKLVYCHSKSKNEFWSALLEKAYAKLFGDYESLKEGLAINALVDFTGGVPERFDVVTIDEENETTCKMVFSQLEEALANSALIVAEVKNVNASELASEEEAISGGAIDVPEGTDVLVLNSSPPATQSGGSDATRAPKTGYFRDNSIVRDSFMTDGGLLMDHGYNLREIKNIQIRRGESYRMVRLQTPWQTGQWMGRWSNVSQEMKSMTVQERNKLGLKFENESDFWMLLSDFLANFTHMDVCHFFKTSMFTLKRSWTESALTGEWINSLHDNRSGGSLSHATFFNNPQYMFDMTVSSNSVNYPLMVSLEQNDRTLVRRGERGSKNSSIGFTIMKVEENREYRLHRVADVITSSDYSTDRSVFLKTPLNAGRYVIVPTIEKPGPVGQFFLRVYNSCGTVAKELMRDEPNSTKPCCGSAVFLAVQLTVTRAEDLINEKRDVLNPFCVVKCEGDSVKTKVIKDSSSPQWNDKFIFYKKANGERKPITLQIFSSQTLSNTPLGEAEISDFSDSEGQNLALTLFQKSKKKDVADIELPGRLHVHVCSSENLSEF